VVTQPGLACRLALRAKADRRAWLVVSARPCNPEGISFIHRISLNESRDQWLINRRHRVHFGEPAELYAASDYAHGDVAGRLFRVKQRRTIVCDVGLATAAVLFEIHGGSREVVFHVPLRKERKWPAVTRDACSSADLWADALKDACRLQVPDERMQFLYEAALRTVILHSPGDVYPGPFTYKRFWFRDAAFIINALLATNQYDRVERAINRFPQLQTALGFFHSQDGEWDSNGAAIWLLDRFRRLSGRPLSRELIRAVEKGASKDRSKNN